MTTESITPGRIPLQVSRGSVVASVQVDLTSAVVAMLQRDALAMIAASRSKGLVIDLSGIDLIEPDEFRALIRTLRMAELMGARPVLCGLKPGVVSALVDLESQVDEVEATRSIDDALSLIAEDDDVDHEHEITAQSAMRRAVSEDEDDYLDPQ